MIGVARELVDSRLKKSSKGRSDMLASFIRHGLTKDDLFTEAVLHIPAGSDTTATAIRSTMLYLIAHPRIYYRLRVEVEVAVSSGAAPAVSSIVQDATLRNFPYLQAVVREGLRVFPPVTDVVRREYRKVVIVSQSMESSTISQVALSLATTRGACIMTRPYSVRMPTTLGLSAGC